MQRIVKIAENHVQVQTVHYDEKVNGEEVIDHIEVYGQQRIDQEAAKAEGEKERLGALVIPDEIAKEDVKLATLLLIQAEMDS